MGVPQALLTGVPQAGASVPSRCGCHRRPLGGVALSTSGRHAHAAGLLLPGCRGFGQAVFPRKHRRALHKCFTTALRAAAQADTLPVLREKVAGSWVYAPPGGAPRGVLHFLGGAFAGASPQVAYALLLELLAAAGYTVVATPFAVTFNHLACAREVHEKFDAALAGLRASGRGAWAPPGAPVHGVGHSNGALLHALIGATRAPAVAGNVLISFNNKQVGDAIPVPLDGVQLAAAGAGPWAQRLAGLARSPAATDVLQRAVGALAAAGVPITPDTLADVAPVVEQLGSVFDEVGAGTVEFTPTPAQSRALIGSAYSVPFTLLVQFRDDTIDETQELFSLLKVANFQGTKRVILPGTHVTPCGADVAVRLANPAFDAGVAAVRAAAQRDLRGLATRIVTWLETRQ